MNVAFYYSRRVVWYHTRCTLANFEKMVAYNPVPIHPIHIAYIAAVAPFLVYIELPESHWNRHAGFPPTLISCFTKLPISQKVHVGSFWKRFPFYETVYPEANATNPSPIEWLVWAGSVIISSRLDVTWETIMMRFFRTNGGFAPYPLGVRAPVQRRGPKTFFFKERKGRCEDAWRERFLKTKGMGRWFTW